MNAINPPLRHERPGRSSLKEELSNINFKKIKEAAVSEIVDRLPLRYQVNFERYQNTNNAQNPTKYLKTESKSPLKFLENIIYPTINSTSVHKIIDDTPWPRPSPYNSYSLANSVVNVPKKEIEEFKKKVVTRYIKTIRKQSLANIKEVFTEKIIEKVSDENLTKYVFETSLSRMLKKYFSKKEKDIFFNFLDDQDLFYTFSHTSLDSMKTYEGMYARNTIVLFKKLKDKTFPIAIYINDQVLTQEDGDRWELAKIYVLQGAALVVTSCSHPKVHFPVDSLNGITKVLLPKNHTIYQLLEPHLYIQLAINFAVLYLDKSVTHGNQNEIYTPYPTNKDGFFEHVAIGYQGIKGEANYSPYCYPMKPEKIDSPYGIYLKNYWDSIYRFVSNIVKKVDKSSKEVTLWAKSISNYIPGFPDGQKIQKGNNLELALTSYIHTVTIVHAGDHYTYSRIPLKHAPLRIRIPFPDKSETHFKLDLSKIIHKEDYIRHRFCNTMYFKEHNLTLLKDCEYNFFDPELIDYSIDFKNDLIRTNRHLGQYNYVPLDNIAASIQY